ncbi:MAG: hypoxanthine phosphoribosyltransferase [Myxococcales bacterium FL481]|nr:MAG: hypoxanthine phosphoribosyltransferase [Myxococcales bacterium FL481]
MTRRTQLELARDLDKVLFSAEQIAARVRELGEQVAQDYADRPPLLVGILCGCFPFLADLVRSIDLPLRVDFMGLSSYGDDTASSGVVRTTKDLERSIEGEHVLVVEDIVDTGLTMRYLLDNLRTRRPASLEVCALLHKPGPQALPVRYVGFPCPDAFVVGYGLDYAGRYRNLPMIGSLRSHAR